MTFEEDCKKLVDRFVVELLGTLRQHLMTTLDVDLAPAPAPPDVIATPPKPATRPRRPKAPKAPKRPIQPSDGQLGLLATRAIEVIARDPHPAGRNTISEALGISPALATLVLKELLDTNRIVRRGTGRGTWYGLADEPSTAAAPETLEPIPVEPPAYDDALTS